MVYFKFEQGKKIITALSVGLSIIAVLFLAMAREPYAITVMFLLLFIKSGLLYKQAKAGQWDIQWGLLLIGQWRWHMKDKSLGNGLWKGDGKWQKTVIRHPVAAFIIL